MKKSENNKPLIEGLNHLLADTYVLYVVTQHCHWNVLGPNFIAYHKMFEEQYQELASAIDEIAERIRALKTFAQASLRSFLKLSSLKEIEEQMNAEKMLNKLLADHEHIAEKIFKLFDIADQSGDEVTLDLLIKRKTAHDKTAWMLRSSLEGVDLPMSKKRLIHDDSFA
ncbi:MAG: hypothetical protein A3F11_06440 [Gammaproteobacteria bacterium RIFCSPHIGHO2_12_FULL_37_14]|nr:MAG: hypothetical protein A3F11_06440 [Gammaproteobacteria bacterium RIFCSPHIGHO2_12_FULL_37_14]